MNRFGRRKEKRGTHTTLKSCNVWLLRRKTENLCKAAWKTMSPWDRQRRKRRKHDEILCVEGGGVIETEQVFPRRVGVV